MRSWVNTSRHGSDRSAASNLRALSTYPCLRLQLLSRPQLVHLAEELLEQLATFRPNPLLELVHNFLWRHSPIEFRQLGQLPSE
jgi:hypothetical protein